MDYSDLGEQVGKPQRYETLAYSEQDAMFNARKTLHWHPMWGAYSQISGLTLKEGDTTNV